MGRIHRIMEEIAREAMRGGAPEAFRAARGPAYMYDAIERPLRRILKNRRADLLGEIGAKGIGHQAEQRRQTGRTSLYEVHWGTWIGKYDGGRTILVDLAATAIVAYLWDNRHRLYPGVFPWDEGGQLETPDQEEHDQLAKVPDRAMHWPSSSS